MTLWGGIEAGGTKFVCAVGTGPGDILAKTRFPTTTPAETIRRVVAFFQQQSEPVAALGIGTFGPIDLDPSSRTYGYITSTAKPGWQQTDICDAIQGALDIPIAFDTDVNAAALGEQRWGAARHKDNLLYLTVGTGIGGGVIVSGKPVHGLLHPEIGHMPIPHDWQADSFEGACPYHGDCLEG